jgi:hypothetical protein
VIRRSVPPSAVGTCAHMNSYFALRHATPFTGRALICRPVVMIVPRSVAAHSPRGQPVEDPIHSVEDVVQRFRGIWQCAIVIDDDVDGGTPRPPRLGRRHEPCEPPSGA